MIITNFVSYNYYSLLLLFLSVCSDIVQNFKYIVFHNKINNIVKVLKDHELELQVHVQDELAPEQHRYRKKYSVWQ